MNLLASSLLTLAVTVGPIAPVAIAAADGVKPAASPLSPAEAKASFEMEPGLAVELLASEPLVVSPCAVAWDEHGRMFVAENRGYPTGGLGGEAVGRIALLTDTDGDGLPDRRTEFATGLTFPNGVMPWRGGLIVTCAPDVLFLRDADGDGVAEHREVLLTGFAVTGSTQLRVNDPTLGPDGWVYLAGGLSAGVVHSPRKPDVKLDLARHDVKFRPDTGEMELVDGKGQFGLTFDDAGHRFVCYNRVQVQHAPLPSRYLARNPLVTAPGVLHNCPELVVNTLLGLGGDAGARIFPISSNVTTADSHAGTYSAACGVHVARGDALPGEYVGAAWSCDPTANLVRCDELVPTGGTFHAKRMHDGTEALRSRDDWFRPVFLADGPDGALYVCDMYRRTIEHPDYLPEEVRKRTDFEGGKGMGRIWRIKADHFATRGLAWKARLHLDDVRTATPESLIHVPNGWVRDTAFRLATERGRDDKITFALEHRLEGPAHPASSVAALNLLANAGTLRDAALSKALAHTSPMVRENAARVAGDRLGASAALGRQLRPLADDDDPHVRYAATLALGNVPEAEPSVVAPLARVARRDAGDKWFRAAILTAVPRPETRWHLLAALAQEPAESDGVVLLLREMGQMFGAEAQAGEASSQLGLMLSHADALGFDGTAALLVGFAERQAPELRRRLAAPGNRLGAIVERARAAAADPAVAVARRATAVSLLGAAAAADDPASADSLLALAVPDQPGELALAAVRALVQPGRDAGVRALLAPERWQRYTPALRGAVVTSVVGRPEFAGVLVDAMESGAVPVSALSAGQREWLKGAGDDALKARAAKLVGTTVDGDRQAAFVKSKAALQLKPDPAMGRRMFANHCASCHRLDREGVAVGPDLLGIRNQPKESILLHVVIPEQEVASNFAAYECVTKDGRSLTGIVTADSPASVTIRQVLGLEETIPRDQIQSLTVSKFPLMPQGLEKLMTPQQMSDLLAYLRGEQ